MFLLIYRIAIGGYSFGIRIASLFKEKARLFVAGRRDWRARLLEKIPEGDITPSVWFHCASLGEFEQGRPVIERIREVYPNHRLVLTFFSPSGYEIRKEYAGADVICYLPIDSPKNARDFISIIKPEATFFVKYEYWFFYLQSLKALGIPTYMVSSIFRNGQPFFKWHGPLHRKMLSFISCFFVQNETSKTLLNRIGFNNVEVTGDTRYDRVVTAIETIAPIPNIETWCDGSKVLVAGSTWNEDEKILSQLEEFHSDRLKMIIVPHEISSSGINTTLERFGSNAVAYSKWDESDDQINCIVVDSIGLLMRLYRYADLAYVGGGFGAGIHNTLEAAVYGPPVIFGPNHKRFQEAVQLVNAGGAFVINDQLSLQKTVTSLLMDDIKLKSIRESNRKNIIQNAGATQRILASLKNRNQA
ncbi:MAG: 3-deoxy-D-manno-octulosonic acid transferase [Arcticibacter sp.]